MSFWHRDKEEKENSEEDLENGAKDVRDGAYETDDTDSEVDRDDRTSISPKYSYSQVSDRGVSQAETGEYAKDIQTLRGLQGVYESEKRIHELGEEKQETPWRDREKRKSLTRQTKEEKENLAISKKLAAAYLRKKAQEKTLAKYEGGMEKIGSGIGRVASGIQRQVEGKGGVTVRGGTVYPKQKRKYVKRTWKKPYSKRTRTKKTKARRKTYRAKSTKSESGVPIFSGFITGGGKKGKRPPLFFNPWG